MNSESENSLLKRYINNYNLSENEIDLEKIYKHWELEKELAISLKATTKETRNQVFISAYNTLYKELPWLLKVGSNIDEKSTKQIYTQRWLNLLQPLKDKKIYEVGSGNGALINFLAEYGATGVGTEIANQRPKKEKTDNVEWHITDGVHLTLHEDKSSYDYLISDQLIEHLHPNDLALHFAEALELLKNRGKFIFYTPHYYIGPGDVSLIFKTQEAEGMHLKEYKYFELNEALKNVVLQKFKP